MPGKKSQFYYLKEIVKKMIEYGFKDIIIHTSFYFKFNNSNYFKDARKKLKELVEISKGTQLHIEYIKLPKYFFSPTGKKFEVINIGDRIKEFIEGYKNIHILLDTHNIGGVNNTIKRIKEIGNVPSIHIHDNHNFISINEFKKIVDFGYSGIIVNEGYKINNKECSNEEVIKWLILYKSIIERWDKTKIENTLKKYDLIFEEEIINSVITTINKLRQISAGGRI